MTSTKRHQPAARTANPRVRKSRPKIERAVLDEIASIDPLPGDSAPIQLTDVVTPDPVDPVITAATSEEPLPLLVAAMAFWRLGIVVAMAPLGLFSLIASPFLVAGSLIRSER
jgi:hypothetical protein